MAIVINPAAGDDASAQVKHASREIVREARAFARTVRLTWSEAEAGAHRATLLVPGYVRLARWKLRRAKLRSQLLERVLPLSLALGATISCGFVSKDGGGAGAPLLSPLPPELAKTKRGELDRDDKAPWAYVLPIDHGVRADESGDGYFRAPRFHGEHNGIDLLAPVGTPTFAACDGQVMTGVSGSFGRWAHVVCPVPETLVKKGSPQPWASFFYAHLDKLDLEQDKWLDVQAGTRIGTVGKTGNARGPNVQPHLHLELIVQSGRKSAQDERHLGRDQSGVEAADFFAAALDDTCLSPLGLQAKTRQVLRARRVDPFLALVCLSPEKPRFVKAPEPLEFASIAWSDLYVATDFNVNASPRPKR